jgi:ketosteroid isomerase-like protein
MIHCDQRGALMTELEVFVESILPRVEAADTALHNGDASKRAVMWSHDDPVTLFGAAFTASGWSEVGSTFDLLASRFSNCASWEFELLAAGASGDLAYTVGIERTTASVAGAPATPYALRVTTIFRREDGEWKIVHRHGDPYDAAAEDVTSRIARSDK